MLFTFLREFMKCSFIKELRLKTRIADPDPGDFFLLDPDSVFLEGGIWISSTRIRHPIYPDTISILLTFIAKEKIVSDVDPSCISRIGSGFFS